MRFATLGEIVTPDKEQEAIGQMFDQIASTYDLVNRLLSFKQDVRWRRAVAKALPSSSDLSLLDVATGTADLLITLCEQTPAITDAIGVDIADNMLSCGEKKLEASGFAERARVQKADARRLPFCESRFDVVTIAFGIRNVVNIDEALDEMRRVLKPGGLLVILEFSLPTNKLWRMIYLCYFRHILPVIGGLFSKNQGAYRYLNRTVESFYSVETFRELLAKRGFTSVSSKSLSFGIATMYCAGKN
jgi:demethylmenaquinone methyltransferase/2-methoxy-6-polyprenyl-1,4-benzoquinol methylase